MNNKKIVAGLMALTLVFSGSVLPSGVASNVASVITAKAAVKEGDCYSFDEETGELTLRGEVDADVISEFTNSWTVYSVIAEEGTVFPEDCSNLFGGCGKCTSIDLSNVDTSNVTNMRDMFLGCCSNLTFLDISSFDTSNVTDMSGMFEGCGGLSSLDLSSFDTSNVTDMHEMFKECVDLTSLDVSGFDTSNVTDMSNMFDCCASLESLDLSGFDTSNVTDMNGMFCWCRKLTSLDVSSFDTSKVTDMSNMFWRCFNLASIDLSSFDTSNVTNMERMFRECYSLTSLDVSGFDTSIAQTSSMFSGCSNLKNLSLGENFKNVTKEAALPNGEGWVNAKAPSTVVSGNDKFAVIENDGKNTYKQYEKLTYPTNIQAAYSEQYHQIRFTWDKVEDADRYGIAVYLAGKWRIQTQNITDTTYTTPKNLTPGKTYKVAIAARVNGNWDVNNAIKNAVTVTVK